MNRYLLTILFVIPNNVLAHISNLVLPVSYSVNRVELLTELKYKLAKYRSTSLVGISGIGKTQLARSYGYNQQDKYNLIWFIDCSLDINEEFLKLAKAINLSVKTNLIPEDVLIVKKSIIDYLTCQDRWLIVFDNLKVGENQKVQEFLNWEHNGNVITCSQDMESLPNIISINRFSQNDAMILANNILEAKHDEFSAWLAKTFNGYPLLIMQGAQLANHLPVLDKEEYKKKILNAANQIKSNIILTMSKLKPSARTLLAKIALINNQRFSKDLLYLITNNYALDTDLYQLYEHMLIDSTNKANLEFEMHDVVAQQILKISGKDNKKYLQEIIVSIANTMLKHTSAGIYMLCQSNTVNESLATILEHAETYQLNINYILDLRNLLVVTYLNSYDRYKAEKMIDWFLKKESSFPIWAMNDYQKRIYAGYLAMIGYYYEKDLSDFKNAIIFVNKVLKILDGLKPNTRVINLKYNYISHLAISQAWLGNIDAVEESIARLALLAKHKKIEELEVDLAQDHIKAVLSFLKGNHLEALEHINQDEKAAIKYTQAEDLALSETYFLKCKILNCLEQYQKAYAYAEKIQKIHQKHKKENARVLGRILTQMAKAELGLKKIDQSLKNIQKAIAIFLADERRNPKNANYIDDPDLADSYVVEGDIFVSLDRLQEGIESYLKAKNIYFHLYKEQSKNIAHVSYLYLQGAKAACRYKDLFFYKAFGKPQIKEFGLQHPNTVKILKYGNTYNMNIWSKGN